MTETEKVIVKVQLGLSGKSLLVYNKDRSYFETTEEPKAAMVLARLLNLAPMDKVYAEAELRDGDVFIKRIADKQDYKW